MTAQVDASASASRALEATAPAHESVWRDCVDHSFPIRASGLDGGVRSTRSRPWTAKSRLLHSRPPPMPAARWPRRSSRGHAVELDLGAARRDGRRRRGPSLARRKGKQLHEEIHASTFDAAAFRVCARPGGRRLVRALHRRGPRCRRLHLHAVAAVQLLLLDHQGRRRSTPCSASTP